MYQVWITVEQWENDEKIVDVDSCKLTESASEQEARILFDSTQAVSLAMKPYLPVKFEEER